MSNINASVTEIGLITPTFILQWVSLRVTQLMNVSASFHCDGWVFHSSFSCLFYSWVLLKINTSSLGECCSWHRLWLLPATFIWRSQYTHVGRQYCLLFLHHPHHILPWLVIIGYTHLVSPSLARVERNRRSSSECIWAWQSQLLCIDAIRTLLFSFRKVYLGGYGV